MGLFWLLCVEGVWRLETCSLIIGSCQSNLNWQMCFYSWGHIEIFMFGPLGEKMVHKTASTFVKLLCSIDRQKLQCFLNTLLELTVAFPSTPINHIDFMSDYVTEVHKEGNKTSNFFHIDYLVLCEIFKNLLCKLTSKINYCYKNIQ